MKVFIIGGSKQTYLATQVVAIHDYILDCEDIVYLTGPIHQNPLLASSTEHLDPIVPLTMLRLTNDDVKPQLKFMRNQSIINCVCEKYLNDVEYGLFLHGDLIPIATMTKEILLDSHLSAGCRGHSIQWCLTKKGIGHTHKDKRNVKIWPIGTLKINEFAFQIFQPGFIHADDLATDSIDLTQQKLEEIKRAYPPR